MSEWTLEHWLLLMASPLLFGIVAVLTAEWWSGRDRIWPVVLVAVVLWVSVTVFILVWYGMRVR